eukprot:scaffold14793_cov37-Tisochrysis_lutea.AAC.2
MFTKDERAEYNFGAFEEDLYATCPGCKEDQKMTWDDVIKLALTILPIREDGCHRHKNRECGNYLRKQRSYKTGTFEQQ